MIHRLSPGAVLALPVAALLAGCGGADTGFTLPAGEADKGRVAFVDLGCQSCHTMSGVEGLSDPGIEREMSIELGGVRDRVMTYDELVTSVINPSHKLSRISSSPVTDESGESRMPSFNDVMTVTELVNIVTFLEEQYELPPYDPTEYNAYGPF